MAAILTETDFWKGFDAAEGGVELTGNGTDSRKYLQRDEWIARKIQVKATLKMSDPEKTKDGISKPFLLVIVENRAYSAYLSTAVKAIIAEAKIEVGGSLKNMAKLLTLAVGVEDGKRTFQICISGGGDL